MYPFCQHILVKFNFRDHSEYIKQDNLQCSENGGISEDAFPYQQVISEEARNAWDVRGKVRDENEGDKDMAKIEKKVNNFGRVRQKCSSDIFLEVLKAFNLFLLLFF